MKRANPSQGERDADDSSTTADTPEYLQAWAESLVRAAGEADARLTLAAYKAAARNKALDKSDRAIARRRAEALGKVL